MTENPPIIDEKKDKLPVTGKLENLYCSKCKKSLSLRDIDVSRHEEGLIKCKTCGQVVLDQSKKLKK